MFGAVERRASRVPGTVVAQFSRTRRSLERVSRSDALARAPGRSEPPPDETSSLRHASDRSSRALPRSPTQAAFERFWTPFGGARFSSPRRPEMMSIFKKAAPEPPAKVEPKEARTTSTSRRTGTIPPPPRPWSTRCTPSTRKTCVSRTAPARAPLRSNAHARTQVTSSCANDYNAPFSVGRFPPSPRPRVPERRARTIPEGKRDESGRHDSESAGNPGWRGRRPVSATRLRCHHRNRSFPRRRETDRRQTRVFHV